MQRARILFVDDDPDDRELIERLLREEGLGDYRILSGGRDLLQHLHALPDTGLPEVVVLDLNMPAIGGRELVHVLKDFERYQSIIVFLLTTAPRGPEVAECIRSGAAGYYGKPGNVAAWRELLHELYGIATDSWVEPGSERG
ncbi:response regulator [Flaviaesturariibacter amylovorans]|uniref:Response regulatory domain-containing protein n=1 Tax=Flaviaesturariibacter amylovorans TaxID=1084520 RepID=A0ABP8HQW9_9BACT